MDAKQAILQFLKGDMDIVDFRRLYDEGEEINDVLQGIIDDIRNNAKPVKTWKTFNSDNYPQTWGRTTSYFVDPASYPGVEYGDTSYESVRKRLTFEWRLITHNVQTASGALNFYDEVYDIYGQLDDSIPYCNRYSEAFRFAIDVIPDYLAGGAAEIYIQKNILPLFPPTMSKTARKKAIRAKIREEFRTEKGYPAWAQSSEWPLGKNGKPTTYLGKKKRDGDLERYLFRDESDGSEIVVEQLY